MRILVSHRTRSLVPTVAHLLEALQQRFGMHAVKVDTPQTSTMKVRRKEKGRRRDKRGRRGRTGLASAPAAPRAWLGDAQALVVVIDPHWTQALALKRDRVRGLLEAAFEKGLIVVPVLYGGAELPESEALPESLQPLLECPAVRLASDESLVLDAQRLIHTLTSDAERRMLWAAKERAARVALAEAAAAAGRTTSPGRRWGRVALVAAAVLLCVAAPLWWSMASAASSSAADSKKADIVTAH